MENQIILVDKPAGISSFGVVAKVRRALSQEFGHKVKVGHTGTLDPFATGLLILLTGKMTKKSNEFLKLDKTYEATLRLGYTSTTGDPEGEIKQYDVDGSQKVPFGRICGCNNRIEQYASSDFLQHNEISRVQNSSLETVSRNPYEDFEVSEARDDGPERTRLREIEFVLNGFIGEISQQVPQYSAVKINGQRAYKLARAGKDFETPTRKVTIYSIEILDYHYPELKIRTHVSSGTYIRTLAEDIGEKLGTGAYLTALRRTEIDKYNIKDAKPLEDFATE